MWTLVQENATLLPYFFMLCLLKDTKLVFLFYVYFPYYIYINIIFGMNNTLYPNVLATCVNESYEIRKKKHKDRDNDSNKRFLGMLKHTPLFSSK